VGPRAGLGAISKGQPPKTRVAGQIIFDINTACNPSQKYSDRKQIRVVKYALGCGKHVSSKHVCDFAFGIPREVQQLQIQIYYFDV
jgi:hypothetical protein